MKLLAFFGILVTPLKLLSAPTLDYYNKDAAGGLKRTIIELAMSFNHQGDPDYTKENKLKPLVDQLTDMLPQKPISERLHLLRGAWKQVWGKYSLKDRLVDPKLSVDEIYHVVFPGKAVMYNIAPLYKANDKSKDKKETKIGLLRSEYKIENNNKGILKAKFKKYPGVDPRPDEINLWDLAELAENDQLSNEVVIAPTFVVKYFLKNFYSREVYTDENLRIMYFARKKDFSDKHLHIMKRATEDEFNWGMFLSDDFLAKE